MEIGVIGAGNVGGTLGRRWAQAGHAVVFGVRDPNDEKVRTLLHGRRECSRRPCRRGGGECGGRLDRALAAHDAVRSAGNGGFCISPEGVYFSNTTR
jgi:predicted dinucleotide-binding enzyme